MTDEATAAKPKKKRGLLAAEARAAGKCGRCLNPLPKDATFAHCDGCREKRAKAHRARRDEKRKRRLCIQCGDKLFGVGKARCAKCRKIKVAEARKRVAERRAAGTCIKCGLRPAVTAGKCDPCRDKHLAACRGNNVTHERRLANGQCVTCGGPRVGEIHASCDDCRKTNSEKQKQRQADRLAAGLCRRCGKHKHVKGGTSCKKCRAKRRWLGRDGGEQESSE